MKDEEFENLKKRFLFGLFIVTLFTIPALVLVYRIYGDTRSDAIWVLDKNEDALFFITENKCENCKEVKNYLKQEHIKYIEVHKEKNPNYKDIIKELGLYDKEVATPGLIYVEKGKMHSNIFGIKDNDTIINYINYLEGGNDG